VSFQRNWRTFLGTDDSKKWKRFAGVRPIGAKVGEECPLKQKEGSTHKGVPRRVHRGRRTYRRLSCEDKPDDAWLFVIARFGLYWVYSRCHFAAFGNEWTAIDGSKVGISHEPSG
jgi:hypothetical protein